MGKILIFIPAYRCETQIKRVISQFTPDVQQAIDTVMVVDNRSPDDTLKNAIDAAKTTLTDCNFIAWKNDDNYGLGGSHKAAFRYAIEKDFDYLIVLHGDDQADIRDLMPYLQKKTDFDIDCLLGARFMSGSQLKGYSLFRTFGNRVYNLLFSSVVMKNIFDLGSGLNMYRLNEFREFYYKKFPDDLTFNYIMLLGSYFRKQKVEFFPISWREEDQISNVRLFRQGFKVLSMLSAYFLRRAVFLSSEMRAKKFEAYTGKIVYSSSKESVEAN